jgi:hypothetical protein
MAVAVQAIPSRTPPRSEARRVRIRWRLAGPIVAMSLALGMVGSATATHSAEVAQTIDAGRELVAGTGAWLSTVAAQAFTMQCAHARVR